MHPHTLLSLSPRLRRVQMLRALQLWSRWLRTWPGQCMGASMTDNSASGAVRVRVTLGLGLGFGLGLRG